MKYPVCAVLALLACLTEAAAQRYEVYAGRSVARMSREELGSNNPDDPVDNETTFRNGYGLGVRLTLNTRGYYGHELFGFYNRVGLHTVVYDENGNGSPADVKVRIAQVGYNFLSYMMPRGSRIRPYLTVGLHAAQHENPKIAGWSGFGTRNYGFNYGGGIKLLLSQKVLLRADIRDYLTGKPYELRFSDITKGGGAIRQQEFSFGLAFGF